MYISLFVILSLLTNGIHSYTILNNVKISSDFLQEVFYKIPADTELEAPWNDLNSQKCLHSIKEIIKRLPSKDVAPFLDAWGKYPSGFLYSNNYDLGNYDQCVRISVPLTESVGVANGKYCFAKIPLVLETQSRLTYDKTVRDINIGICVPETCSPEFLTSLFQKSDINADLKEALKDMTIGRCSNGKTPPLTTINIVAISIFGVVTGLMIISSLYDFYVSYYGIKPVPVLLAYSVLTNGKKLFAINTKRSPNNIDCLTSIRVISMIWIMNHHMFSNYFIPAINQNEFYEWINTFVSMPALMGTSVVDSFFFIGGLLVAWSGFRELDRTNGKMNIIMNIVHRYIRLTPVVGAGLLLIYGISNQLYVGPFSDLALSKYECNSKNWWPVLVYIQNYFIQQPKCYDESWYLAVDFQLYVLSPLLLIPMWKWGKKLYPLIVGLITASCIYVMVVFFNYEFTAMTIGGNDGEWELTYVPMHTRFAPWLVGFVLGYFMHKNRQTTFELSPIVQLLGWIASIGTFVAIVYGPYFTLSAYGEGTVFESAVYAGLKRVSWSLALAWITFACHYGFGGIIDTFLSHPVWQPFGRLTYSLYLMHMSVIRMHFGMMRTELHFGSYDMFLWFWSAFGITFFISIYMSLAFEGPILVLEKFIFGDKAAEKKSLVEPSVSPKAVLPQKHINDILRETFLSELRNNKELLHEIHGENFYQYDSKKCFFSLKELSSVGNSHGVQFFDAWGKIPSGIKQNNLYGVGHFDQCVETTVSLSNSAAGKVSGQYCFAQLPLSNASLLNDETFIENLNLNIGICVPNSCSPEVINSILRKSLQRSSNGNLSDVIVSDCTNGQKPPLRFIHIFGIVVFSSVAVLMVASTFYEFYTSYTAKQPVPVLLAFSILSNGRKMFNINTKKSPNSIDCLTGLRVLSMIWVIQHHVLLMHIFIPTLNQIKSTTFFLENIWYMSYMNAGISVDTFFFMSGLLVAWTGFKELDKTNGKLNIVMMYVHRYIRLTPVVAAVLLFNVSLHELIYTGPFRELMLRQNICDSSNWWRILTYIQNYFVPEKECLDETWYLAVDFQLYLAAPFLLIMMWKYGKKFAPVLVALALTSTGYVTWAFVNKGYVGVVIGVNQDEWTLTNIPTHARTTSWLVGLGLGYFMHINRQTKFQIPKIIQILAWISSLATLFFIVFGPYMIMDDKRSSTNFLATIKMYFLPVLITFLLINGINSFLIVNNVTINSDILRESFLSEIRNNNELLNEIHGENFNEYDSKKCILSLKELSSAGNSHGVQFFDAWGKISSGIKQNNLYGVGHFDQCVETTVSLSNSAAGKVSGQYCFAQLPLSNASLLNDETFIENLNLNIGICVPNSCSPEVINSILRKSLQRSSNGNLSDVIVSDCTNGKIPPLRFIHIFGILVFSSVAVLMVASTFYDLYTNYTEKQPVPVLLAFSILSNGRKMFNINTTKSPNNIDCLTGLRVISMVWIIHHHTLLIHTFIPTLNQIRFKTFFLENIWFMTYMNAGISVDTFFFMAGLLVAWTGFKELDKTNGKLNIVMMYVHRYIRLTPVVAAVLLFNVSLNELIYTGPFRESMLRKNVCDNSNWWRTLTYIQNYFVPEKECLGETWYLAVDFHLYLAAPFLLIMMWKYGKKFAPVLVALALTSMGYVTWVFFKKGYVGVVIGVNMGQWTLTNIPTHARISSWLVGFGLGYFMHINRQTKFQIPKIIQILAWISSLATLFFIVFGPYMIMDDKRSSTNFIATMYESWKRTLWAIALAWIAFACHFGFGGTINSILSHPIWQPIARLGYTMYLVHMSVLRILLGSSRLLGYFSAFELIQYTWSAFGISLFFAIFLALGFESPILILEKFIFSDKKQKSKEDKEDKKVQ
ncbi:uncharacterized protein LOC129948480 [Eupeodes corollae]|uniref:uncharacterized protein LOC129948480 n=1 Tax=Eupeodes corollae TaxID=290404 RepID=UPI00249159D5|nr:uncharacterized protein LOC129948480 [Eupeodes corollae]